MGLFDIFKKKTPKNDLDELLAAFAEFAKAEGGGLDIDEFPNATGAFGLDPNNPIPTISGGTSRSYLSRLRTMDGNPINFRRTGSYRSTTVNHPVDGYKITDIKNNEIGTLFTCMYAARDSNKAPDGFRLVSR